MKSSKPASVQSADGQSHQGMVDIPSNNLFEDNKDEITALQILYNRPYKERLNFDHLKELSATINAPPYLMNRGQVWEAYAALEKSKVKGAGRQTPAHRSGLTRTLRHGS